MKKAIFIVSLILGCTVVVPAQQIDIPRVEQMPNLPSPYEMRDWKTVALQYDSLVYNFDAAGEHLPLIRRITNTINYPGQESFGLHTYVGTNQPQSSEAINVLPSVISATLAGIDKSNQNGTNWVIKTQEFFNKRPEENVYLNHPSTQSGSDWWYDTMPNVFFYQLYDLYLPMGDSENQFRSVADQWLRAVQEMGGSATPWRQASMGYRGWRLSTMEPNESGVIQPEAAGAIGWLLYHAYLETGEAKYRMGAEWAMEYLNRYLNNPSYELQLPYGVYIAAKMNAQLGTQYNIEKLLNWCFTYDNPRGWGAITGNWNGYDVHGLIGEADGNNDYAFLMNTFQHVGALVPMARYDLRFARAIGKWVLNAANAARLFYSYALPDHLQSNEDWAFEYDPHSVIGYEALREDGGFNRRPYATGDAMGGNWAATNLSLYSSSHAGIFAGIIDTTNVPKILQLDMLATDYFSGEAYPTYLYFNPYDEDKTISLELPSGSFDLYDAVDNNFLQYNASGTVSVEIPADKAIVLVQVPAGGTITYELDKMYVNGVVVDYRSGQPVDNYPPRIKGLQPEKSPVLLGQEVRIYCTAVDRDGDDLTYEWEVEDGTISGSGADVRWTAPEYEGEFYIYCTVDDGRDGITVDSVLVEVVESFVVIPEIKGMSASPRKIDINGTSEIMCEAVDPEGYELTIYLEADYGTLAGEESTAEWTAPGTEGNYFIRCIVENETGGMVKDSIDIMVRDFTDIKTGDLIAYYPFNGDANDHSGNGHDGNVTGASLVEDRKGNPASAYSFDGNNDRIVVPNHDDLNTGEAIAIAFWMKIGRIYDRESHPISHGSWQNRLKVSISNSRLRWTINTTDGIIDLDSETILEENIYYHVVVQYDGSDIELYLNGELDSFSSFTGTLIQTSIDLTIGAMLPTNLSYNFNGIIDEVRIYDYALSVQEIKELYGDPTYVKRRDDMIPRQFKVFQNYPNPFNPSTVIRFQIPDQDKVTITIFDSIGRKVDNVLDDYLLPGEYEIRYDASHLSSGIYFYRVNTTNSQIIKSMVFVR